MKKIYPSKIGLELAIPLILILGYSLYIQITEKPNFIGIAILAVVILFAMHLFMTTNYTIEEDKLIIKSGFLFHKTIDIKYINKITETNNLLSSPAASLDRLEIHYGKFESVLISPKQKKEFIDEITAINPAIEVKLKNKK